MTETTVSDAVLARLEALTARLDEQAAAIADLKAENGELKAERARLTAVRPSDACPAAEPTARTDGSGGVGQRIDRRPTGAGILKRRGLLAGAAVLVGAGLAKLEAAEPAEATHGGAPPGAAAGLDTIALHIGQSNSTSSQTSLSGNTPGQVILFARQDAPASPIPGGSPIAIAAYAPNGTVAVTGASGSGGAARLLQNIGVYGVTNGSGIGVYGDGQSTGIGVYGQSNNNAGVQGQSTNNAGVYGIGPYGVFATGTGTAAFYGASNGGFGAWGNSATYIGVYGTSTSNVGVRAESKNWWGLHALAPTWAGVFEGNVYVTGRVVALGGFALSAAGASASTAGALAEDVGEGTLVNGRATVTLDQGFADAANGEYRVFLTELADLGGLYVVQKGPRQFEVRSRGGGQAAPSGRFDYRVVAKISGPPGTPQAPLAPPDLTTVKPTPKPPEPPRAPDPSGASQERRQP